MGSIGNIVEENNDACISALQVCFGPVYSAVLNAAIELNLFDIIAKASSPFGVSASDIASQLPKQHPELPRRLDRMLCLLVTHSLLECSTHTNQNGVSERLFKLSPSGHYFVKVDNKSSLAFLSSFLSHRAIVDVFLNYKEILLDFDKGVYEKVHGIPIYEGIPLDPTLNNVFNAAMANLCTIQMEKVLEIYKGFEGISLLVDVAGGIGRNLNMIISKYPSIKGINFDLPHVIQNAPTYPGIKKLGGNMFEGVPKGGDAIMLKAVLHNWSDEQCLKILRNCYNALPQNGKLILVETIMPEEIHSTEAAKVVVGSDNIMLDGGLEKTQKEFESLCKRSGFSDFQVVGCVLYGIGIMEFQK
ncbi:hypothetical protein VNO78_12699 [Psophocarpus tetragonolobus]|uniref:Uncharacterized protein n=1 Tax=Psophocarpus tetragonolobus TaxID=3891 RepID=A0AAN9XQ20_PSOTE